MRAMKYQYVWALYVCLVFIEQFYWQQLSSNCSTFYTNSKDITESLKWLEVLLKIHINYFL